MENEKKKSFSNKTQIEKIVLLMEAHPLIGRGVMKKKEAHLKWQEFSIELNSLGPPIKSAIKWAKVWIDLKSKLKRKLLKKKVLSSVDGEIILSPLEARVSKFFSLDSNASVDSPAKNNDEILLRDHSEVFAVSNITEEEIPATKSSKSIKNIHSRKRIVKNVKLEKLRQDFQKIKSVKNIHLKEKLIKNVKLEKLWHNFENYNNDIANMNETLKEILTYIKKMYYLKKTSLKKL